MYDDFISSSLPEYLAQFLQNLSALAVMALHQFPVYILIHTDSSLYRPRLHLTLLSLNHCRIAKVERFVKFSCLAPKLGALYQNRFLPRLAIKSALYKDLKHPYYVVYIFSCRKLLYEPVLYQ